MILPMPYPEAMILIDWEAYILPPVVHFELSYTADCTSASSHGKFMVGKELKINRKEEKIRRKEEVRQKDKEEDAVRRTSEWQYWQPNRAGRQTSD